jgi:hypothetical protein
MRRNRLPAARRAVALRLSAEDLIEPRGRTLRTAHGAPDRARGYYDRALACCRGTIAVLSDRLVMAAIYRTLLEESPLRGRTHAASPDTDARLWIAWKTWVTA